MINITCGEDGQTPKLQTHVHQGLRGQTFQLALVDIPESYE